MHRTSIISAALGAVLVCATSALAQQFPSKTVRLIVPSTPGGSVDTLARTLAPRLSERWGQQVVVDNRSGAGGAIAAEMTARAAPDGHTMLLGTIASLATNLHLQKKLPYDPVRDLAPVTLVATQNFMLLVHPSLPVRSVKELTAFAKARPGQLSFGSAGSGTGSHLSGELYRVLAGIDILHVPYKGMAPALIDVLAGQVSMTFASLISGQTQAKSGKLRPLAVTGARRAASEPDLPTMREAGIKDYESSTWYGIVVPIATPPDIVNRINAEVVAILKHPEVNERLSREGAEPVGNTPEAFGAHIRNEIAKWGKVIRASGIRAD